MLQQTIIFASNSLHYLLYFTDRLEGAITAKCERIKVWMCSGYEWHSQLDIKQKKVDKHKLN